MNLVAYSDSEGSDNEAPRPPKPAAKPAGTTSKPAFQKMINRSNPGKITVTLPSAAKVTTGTDDLEAEEPPAKKARTGGGGAFGGFNAMLPAPKKAAAPAAEGGARKGKGISFKTSAEPTFSREPIALSNYEADGTPKADEPTSIDAAPSFKPPPLNETPSQEEEVKPAAKPKFVPLSVLNKKKKKAAVTAQSSSVPVSKPASAAIAPVAETNPAPAPKPKVSLFSLSEDPEPVVSVPHAANGQYEPLLYGADEQGEPVVPDDAFEGSYGEYHAAPATAASTSGAQSGPQSLGDIASSMNFTDAERRQLFGRKGRGTDFSAAAIVDFNTDKEYAHNEELRAAGETVEHKALKSISGTGKNSLKSLVNVAQSNKEALEDHFAQGRRNKKEAGNKYGW